MKLYNTLTRTKEVFKPTGEEVKLYACGPTVYHFAHIGNLRNVVFNDTLRRTLEQSGYKVNQVMNATDVGHLSSDGDEGEDKLEKGARREGKTVWEVAQYYLDAFKAHTRQLNVLAPTSLIRATDTMQTQIELIQTLMDKGYVYQEEQAIYFDVTKLNDYGKLSGQNLKDKGVGVRPEVVTDPAKRHPQDFALWFFTVGHFKDHEMRWPSPWGEGFPGWHLECSAIIHQALGEPIDIHTGGVDHIGTHHTNEIAQSEAAFGKPLANFWVHNEFLYTEGSKIAKSEGNTITLPDLVKKGYDPIAFRLMVLQSHYRSQQKFTYQALDAAENTLKNIYAWADLRYQDHLRTMTFNPDDARKHFNEKILAALQDDLNTPAALTELYRLMARLQPGETLGGADFDILLPLLDGAFGLNLNNRQDITEEQKSLIAERQGVREADDYATADKVRDELLQQGIMLEDTPHGPVWRRV